MTEKRKRVVLRLGQKLEIIVRPKETVSSIVQIYCVRKTTANNFNHDFYLTVISVNN